MWTDKIYQGDCLEVLKTFPDECIDCVVTSPPYWALRDYGVEGQLGLEPTFQEYINKLCDIFDEVKRVLKKEGTCWVNLGDTYSQGETFTNRTGLSTSQMKPKSGTNFQVKTKNPVQQKCLLQIPSRFAIEMCNRGWILRNEIIWHKPNCMPSSVKDRFTVDFEKIFFFVKSKKYYFETQYENAMTKNYKIVGDNGTANDTSFNNNPKGHLGNSEQGRNKRCVWRITTKPFKEAHFATYPEALCETPIRAGCPEFVCKKCGKAREKIQELGGVVSKGGSNKSKMAQNKDSYIGAETKCKAMEQREHIDKGYTDCGCNAGWEGGTVLDIFCGAGTTGLVALKLGRKFLGIELNPEYIKLAEKRLEPELAQTKLF